MNAMDTFVFRTTLVIAIMLILFFLLITKPIFFPESHPLTLVGQYTVYNYTSEDGDVKIFLLTKERLNQSLLLQNDNDITEKILVTKIPY